jgi:hypothetical protein
MQIKRLFSPTATGLVWAVGLFAAPASIADDVTVQRTFISPGVYAPVSTTTSTVRSTTVESAPPVSDQIIERRTVILPESTGGNVTSSSSTTIDSNSLQDGKPDYARRIHNLKSQLDKAIANGWIPSSEADSLQSQYVSLLSQEASVRQNGYLRVDCDSIEKNLNAFNIQLSDDMARTSHN